MKTVLALTALFGATLMTGSASAQQQISGAGQFCIKGPTGPLKCEYQTMAQCEQARPPGSSDQCVSRSQLEGTTGGPARGDRATGLPGDQRD
jgi:hypothetical protein